MRTRHSSATGTTRSRKYAIRSQFISAVTGSSKRGPRSFACSRSQVLYTELPRPGGVLSVRWFSIAHR